MQSRISYPIAFQCNQSRKKAQFLKKRPFNNVWAKYISAIISPGLYDRKILHKQPFFPAFCMKYNSIFLWPFALNTIKKVCRWFQWIVFKNTQDIRRKRSVRFLIVPGQSWFNRMELFIYYSSLMISVRFKINHGYQFSQIVNGQRKSLVKSGLKMIKNIHFIYCEIVKFEHSEKSAWILIPWNVLLCRDFSFPQFNCCLCAIPNEPRNSLLHFALSRAGILTFEGVVPSLPKKR